ncbi:putative protein SCO1 -like protein 2, mitochondrial-like [Capsicum annuum]|uniref:Major facilitator superfamily (MFS) profile domain-containing protein n=1 Tax=Capsicum annuum TaxID=4072 RepID=A0A1U8FCK9_CAPAN|nr:uncharacterized protein LOC107852957 [Capsicum annuum]KAF3618603.1 putative protein SCO1 -like protein 2, mitochondrial-like [Capsicum annuum]PHT82004.1 hypothetical protein T459_15019 [Capsicum annuum]
MVELKNLQSNTLTLVLVNIAGIMEKADETLLPGVYKEVGEDLHTDPTGLGSLTLFRSLVQCLCYPLAAYLSARYNRARVIALGAFLWSAATFCVAVSANFTEIAICRGLNGIGLAIVTPAIQSLVADSTNESNRGTAFGWLQLTTNFGSTLGGLISVLLAETSFMGIPGWRIAFHLVGIISVSVGILVRIFATDPRYLDSDGNAKNQPPPQPFQEEMRQLLKEAKEVMKVPSFQLLIAQGISGSFPWSALSFAPMWLELIGFSHKSTAFLWTSFNVAQSLGALFGGIMGDIMGKHLPNSGRIILAQISSGSAVPLAAILLLLLPYDSSSVLVHGLVMFIMGLCVSWNAPATNNPIFAEIVPERARTSIYALDRSFESIISSFAPPLVGILAQHIFGFKPIPKGSTGSEEIETDRQNAASLAKALYTAIGIPISFCCFFYSFLYFTYPRDRDHARLQQTEETGNALSEERQALLENDEQRLLSVS